MLKRVILISTVLCLFYVGFLNGLQPLKDLNEPNENSLLTSKTGRKISSVASKDDDNNFKPGNCSMPTILDFPADGFTREQRQHGWIILHLALLIYGFLFLSAVCDDYLVPSIEQIFSTLNIEHDVLGATVMAAVVSCPDLFMNVIGTFVTKGDIGISTIVGSAIFNVLAVPASFGIFAANCLKLDWWPTTRDCFMYLLTIFSLVIVLSDGQVWWYEALALILIYIVYMFIMYYDVQTYRWVKKYLKKFGYYKPQYREVSEFSALLGGKTNNTAKHNVPDAAYKTFESDSNSSHIILHLDEHIQPEALPSPWCRRDQPNFEFFLRWPMTFLLWLTVPNSREDPSLKYLTIILSMLWIGGISYGMAFAITVISDTLNMPDAVMGLTILAYGMGLPEIVSSILVNRESKCYMDMSNSLGSSTFDVLLGLGLPWFIKAYFFPKQPGLKVLNLGFTSLPYAGTMLLTSLLAFYLLLLLNKFTVGKRIGFLYLIIYISFMITATLIELNVFFPVNLPICRY